MKASELRIGNFYNQFGNETKISWVSLKELEGAPEGKVWCKPIPVTAEWLTRLGFSYGATEKFRFKTFRIGAATESYIYCNEVNDELECGVSIDELDEVEVSTPIAHVKYVHQLQNLYFALTGEELTITD